MDVVVGGPPYQGLYAAGQDRLVGRDTVEALIYKGIALLRKFIDAERKFRYAETDRGKIDVDGLRRPIGRE